MNVTSIMIRTSGRNRHTGKGRSGGCRIAFAVSIGPLRGVLKAKMVALAALVLVGLPSAVPAQEVARDHAIIADPLTGTAMMGYDIVAYFIENRAVPGDPARQISHGGRAWYFSSQANQVAFEDRPAAFQPAFGGHDPVAIAAGVLRKGDPRIFLRQGEQLYFFRDEDARARLAAQPSLAEAAAREWPGLSRDLDP